MSRLTLGLALLVVLPNTLADDYPFGRLFTATSERQQLDDLRKGILPEVEAEDQPQPQLQSLDEATTQIRFSGYVRRSDGSSVLWIDGHSDLTGNQDETGRLLPGGHEAQFKSSFGEMKLKPGQTWHIETDLVTDTYQSAPAAPVLENGAGELQ